MQELLENLDLVKARAAPGTDESKTELVIAHKTIGVLQMAFWYVGMITHRLIDMRNLNL
jgi:hypothetical protein